MRKRLLSVICIFVLLFSMNVSAGTWQRDQVGWWYRNNDGSYPANGWEHINGVWYYFKESGYMARNYHTPDGYYVDFNGAWAAEPSGYIQYGELIETRYFNESTGITMEIGEEGGGGVIYVDFFDAQGNLIWDGRFDEAYEYGYDGINVDFEDWMSDEKIRINFYGREGIDAPSVSSSYERLKNLSGTYLYHGRMYEN